MRITEKAKDFIRKVAVRVPAKITQNQWYDHCAMEIIKRYTSETSNCIDIGCHKGEVLEIFLRYCPNGHHTGIEALPELYSALRKKFQQNNVSLINVAVTDTVGISSFTFVPDKPAYSGILPRDYDGANVKTKHIEVPCSTLDNLIMSEQKVDLIKIDVEGGELGVLKGAKRILTESKPIIIFEHGVGGADHYGTTPEMIFQLMESLNYKIYLLDDLLQSRTYLDQERFSQQFYQKSNYYFVAKQL